MRMDFPLGYCGMTGEGFKFFCFLYFLVPFWDILASQTKLLELLGPFSKVLLGLESFRPNDVTRKIP